MKRLEHYLALPYRVTVTPDECTDGATCYVARIEELPGCESHGETPEEALANVEEARRLYISTMLEDGVEPPAPRVLAEGTSFAMTTIWRVEVVDDDRAEDEGYRLIAGMNTVELEGQDGPKVAIL